MAKFYFTSVNLLESKDYEMQECGCGFQKATLNIMDFETPEQPTPDQHVYCLTSHFPGEKCLLYYCILE